jgi:alpha-tubulin suppressor-like RCC1 family protein
LGTDGANSFVVEQLAVAARHACAVSTTGKSKCWGFGNNNGALGQGNTNGHGADANSMGDNLPVINWGTEGDSASTPLTVKQIAAGGTLTCALLSNGAVKCVGKNKNGPGGYPQVEQTWSFIQCYRRQLTSN